MYFDDNARNILLNLLAASYNESLIGNYEELRLLSLLLLASYNTKCEARKNMILSDKIEDSNAF
jgi:hypothetical protein